MTTDVSAPDRTGTTHRAGPLRRAAVVLAAVAGAVVVWVLAVPVAGVRLEGGGGPITWWMFAAATLAASLAGWAALAVLERFVPSARRWWTVLAAVVLAASMAGPLGIPGLSTGTRAWLAVAHLVVAAVLVPGLRRTARR